MIYIYSSSFLKDAQVQPQKWTKAENYNDKEISKRHETEGPRRKENMYYIFKKRHKCEEDINIDKNLTKWIIMSHNNI